MDKKIDLNKVKKGVQVPQELSENFMRLVTAAKKVIYSDQFKEDLMDQFTNEEGTVGELIAQTSLFGVTTVMNEARGAFGGELAVPAGVYLVADVAEFVEQAGFADVTDKDIGEAMEQFIGYLMNMTKASETMGQGKAMGQPMENEPGEAQEMPGQEEPGEGSEPAEQEDEPKGLIKRGMA